MGGYSRAVTAYLVAVSLALVPLTALAVVDALRADPGAWSGRAALVTALLAVVLVASEMWPVPVARGQQSDDEFTVSSAFGLALVLVAPVVCAVVAQAVALVLDRHVRDKQWSRLPFNVAQYAASFVAARAAYSLGSGEPFTPVPGAEPHLLAAGLAGLVFLLVNNGTVAFAVSLHLRLPLRRVLSGDLRLQLLTAVPLLGLGPVLAQTALWSPAAVGLLLLPIVALQRAGAAVMQREQEALRDPLTGLANRTLLTAATERALQDGRPVALLLLDLDHFKEVNDTLGHAVGDRLLCAVAERLREQAGPDDLVARLGGDEFALLLPGGADAQDVARRLGTALRAPYEVEGVRLTTGCSTGIGLGPAHAATAEGLLRCADVALYQAKAVRGAALLYDPATDQHSVDRLGLQADLRAALEDPDDTSVTIALQPQLDLRSGRVGSVEALVRWRHPVLGPLPPDAFIPMAESTSLIDALLERVLRLGLRVLVEWDAAGLHVALAVNVSARQLGDDALPDVVLGLLAEHGLPPQRLVLEVTESRLMDDPERSTRILRRLRAAGVATSVDDFGTGYSSLAYLQRLDVDELKIDKSFVMGLDEPGNRAIVRSTVRLAHDLGLRVVAEGVEDERSVGALRELGADLLQGYHLGRPQPPDELRTQLLAARGVPAPRPAPDAAPALRAV